MPFAYRIQPKHRLAIMQLHGDLAGPDIKAALLSLTNDPRWKVGFEGLFDARGVTRLAIDPADSVEIVRLPALYRAHFRDSRFGIVVARDMDRDLARLWKYMWLKEQCEVRVYTSLDEALAWLGVPPGAYPEE